MENRDPEKRELRCQMLVIAPNNTQKIQNPAPLPNLSKKSVGGTTFSPATHVPIHLVGFSKKTIRKKRWFEGFPGFTRPASAGETQAESPDDHLKKIAKFSSGTDGIEATRRPKHIRLHGPFFDNIFFSLQNKYCWEKAACNRMYFGPLVASTPSVRDENLAIFLKFPSGLSAWVSPAEVGRGKPGNPSNHFFFRMDFFENPTK